MPHFEMCARLVQTFWPLTTQCVAVADGARREAGHVGARARLAEQLTPDVLAA